MPTYATASALRTWTGLDSTDLPDVEADALLLKAERDLDGLAVTVELDADTGRKFDPASLDADVALALANATCAQAEYRRIMGDEFFVRGQYSEVNGPEYAVKGKLPRVAPQARTALAGTGLVKLTTTTRNRPVRDYDAHLASLDADAAAELEDV